MHSYDPPTPNAADDAESAHDTLPLVSATTMSCSVTVPSLLTTMVYTTLSPSSGYVVESLSIHTPVSTAIK